MNLNLLKIPVFVLDKFVIINPADISTLKIIHSSQIKDFQVFGQQAVLSTVSGEGGDSVVGGGGMLNTMFTESLFGTAAAMKSWFPKSNLINIQTTHEIKDLRVIQVVLNDNTDIEFKGIQIFFDLIDSMEQQR